MKYNDLREIFFKFFFVQKSLNKTTLCIFFFYSKIIVNTILNEF